MMICVMVIRRWRWTGSPSVQWSPQSVSSCCGTGRITRASTPLSAPPSQPTHFRASVENLPSPSKFTDITDRLHDLILWETCPYRITASLLVCPQAQDSYFTNDCFNFRLTIVYRSFLEVLKDREQLEYFRHFLLMHGINAEALLELWIAVEDLKQTMGNKKLFKSKLRRIKERFLTGNLQQCKLRFILYIAAMVVCTSMYVCVLMKLVEWDGVYNNIPKIETF